MLVQIPHVLSEEQLAHIRTQLAAAIDSLKGRSTDKPAKLTGERPRLMFVRFWPLADIA